ncbi:MAG: phage tail assembly protein [Pseudomonadota bacterium]
MDLPEIDGVEFEKTSSGKIKAAIVTLDFPIEVDGKRYTELRLRRMKTRDTYAGEDEEDPNLAGLRLYARLAGVEMDVMDEVDIDDLEIITEAAIPLMGKSAARIAKAEREKLAATTAA